MMIYGLARDGGDTKIYKIAGIEDLNDSYLLGIKVTSLGHTSFGDHFYEFQAALRAYYTLPNRLEFRTLDTKAT